MMCASVMYHSFQFLVFAVLSADLVTSSNTVHSLQARETTTSGPISIAASQDWDGNDGPWSSFALQIGTPPQDVKVLIGTAATQTWAVDPQGCTSSDPSNCGTLRGDMFRWNESSSWVPNLTNISANIYDLGLEANLGYTGNAGRYGFDDIMLGWQGGGGPSLKNQTLATIATKEFYLGVFGLTPRPSNFSSFNEPIPSYMENLRNRSLISSTSWAYTAGNRYRLSEVLGSLTLGGYDTSKFISNNVSWSFNQQDARDLTVDVESITMSDRTSNSALLPKSIPMFMDSTVPYIWLPFESCALFEKAFNLTWNNTVELYLVDDSNHETLLARNASITFTLNNSGSTVNITFPYAAFDLTVDYPIVSNASRYFPLKRADSVDQYTLGRTFFQEAYVIADYDRKNFSVSQCSWEMNSKQQLVPIQAPLNDPSSSGNGTTSTKEQSKSRGLSSGAVVGISIAAVLIIGIIVVVTVWLVVLKPRRERKAKAAGIEAESNALPKPDDPASSDTILKAELDNQNAIHEMSDKYDPALLSEAHGSPVHEMAGERKDGFAEVDGNTGQIHEMPTNEEVATEMTGLSDPSELEAIERRRRIHLYDPPYSPIRTNTEE